MFHFKMFRFRVSSKEKERDMWGTSERKRELAFLSGRTARLSTESANNNVIIINLFLYIRLREKASSSNARGEATRRRDVDLSLSSPSLSLSFSLVLSIHTHSFFSLSDVFCVDLLWLRTLFPFSLSLTSPIAPTRRAPTRTKRRTKSRPKRRRPKMVRLRQLAR